MATDVIQQGPKSIMDVIKAVVAKYCVHCKARMVPDGDGKLHCPKCGVLQGGRA